MSAMAGAIREKRLNGAFSMCFWFQLFHIFNYTTKAAFFNDQNDEIAAARKIAAPLRAGLFDDIMILSRFRRRDRARGEKVMGRSYQTELTTTCMIVDRKTGNVLVQERTNGDWTGMCFPGGHVEDGESYTECVIREVREETGLEIRHPRMEGIVHWENRDSHARDVIVFFRTESFGGTLRPACDEAVNRWVPLATLRTQPLADWFAEQLAVYEDPALQEMYYEYGRDFPRAPRYYRAEPGGPEGA